MIPTHLPGPFRLLTLILLLALTGCSAPDDPMPALLDQAPPAALRHPLRPQSLNWTAPDGERFPALHWPCEEATPEVVLVAIHGLSGAAADFAPLAAHLHNGASSLQAELYAPELRSQRHDPDVKRRGDLKDFQILVRDLHAFLNLAASRHPGVPVVLVGESMGAVLSLHLAAQRPPALSALVLLSPVVDIDRKLPRWQEHIVQGIAALLPRLRIDPSSFTDAKSGPPRVSRLAWRQLEIARANREMPTYTLRFLSGLGRLIENCPEIAPKINVPLLACYAEHDFFIRPAQVEAFFAKLPSAPPRSLHYVPGACHLLLYDPTTPETLAALDQWLSPLPRQHKRL